METRAIYTERKTFVKYDDNHYLLYLNEGGPGEPRFGGPRGERNRSPAWLYAYTGTCEDGGTLIEATSASYDSLVSGLIRREYSADRVEAITLNKLSSDNERKAEFEAEFACLERYRNDCKARVRALLVCPKASRTPFKYRSRCVSMIRRARYCLTSRWTMTAIVTGR